jgi:hypothetical protein
MSFKQLERLIRNQAAISAVCAALAGTLYLIWGIRLLPHFSTLINPDGVSYTEIARQYANGDFKQAINGYWGPLLSWLAAPLIHFFSADPLAAIKIVSLVSGLAVFAGVGLLLHRLKVDGWLQLIVQLALIPVVVSMSLGVVTPDLLVTGLLLGYVAVALTPKLWMGWRWPAAAGAMAALAYYAKGAALVLFLVHYTGLQLWRRFGGGGRNRSVVKSWGIGIGVFFVLILPWVTLLTLKYHHLTFSTAGAYNLALVGPHSLGQPMLSQGLLVPQPGKLSAWSDPSYLKLAPWDPLLQGRHYAVNLFWTNLKIGANFIYVFSGLALGFALLACGLRVPQTYAYRYLGASAVLVLCSYCLFVMEPRYIWTAMILAVVLAAGCIHFLYSSSRLPIVGAVLIALLLGLSVAYPPIGGLTAAPTGHEGDIQATARNLTAVYHIHGRIATNDDWAGTLYISYFTGTTQYLGLFQPGASNAAIARDLAAKRVDYVLVWPESGPPVPGYLADYRLLGPTQPLTAMLYEHK